MDTTPSPARTGDPDRRRVILSPDSFKGTITAATAAAALRAGWLEVRPQDDAVSLPMADGGEGTLDALEAAEPAARRHELAVTGPDGRPVTASWLELPDRTGALELALTSGIDLMGSLHGMTAGTAGLGEAIRDALAAGMERLLIGIGSSASTDGGAGMLQALGARLEDAAGAPIDPGARGLADLASVDLTNLHPLPPRGVAVLSDVRSPLTGPEGAAAVFGPQKGLAPHQIPAVDADLARLADLLHVEPRTPGAGAAGGTGAALLAWGAQIAPGAPEVARAAGLPAALAGADLVITGEGRYDAQTATGKVISHVAQLAEQVGARLAIVAGALQAALPPGVAGQSLTEIAGSSERAMADPEHALREAGRRLAAAENERERA